MARFSIEIKRSAVKEIKKLPAKEIKKVLKKIQQLADDPRSGDSIKLSMQEKYRIRCGVYRILYLIENDKLIVIVVKVGHRGSVYK